MTVNCIVQGIREVAARVLRRVAPNDVLAVTALALQVVPQTGAPVVSELGSLQANQLDCGCGQLTAVG
jgi:hypothetical protein